MPNTVKTDVWNRCPTRSHRLQRIPSLQPRQASGRPTSKALCHNVGHYIPVLIFVKEYLGREGVSRSAFRVLRFAFYVSRFTFGNWRFRV